MLFVAFMPVAYSDVPTPQEKQEIAQSNMDALESKLLTEEVMKKYHLLQQNFDKPNENFSEKCIREYLELFYKDREKIMKFLVDQGCREDFIEFAKQRPDKAFIFIRVVIMEVLYRIITNRPEEDFDTMVLLKVTEYINVGHGTMYFDKPESKLTETDKKMREVADDLTVKNLVPYKVYTHLTENYGTNMNMILAEFLR